MTLEAFPKVKSVSINLISPPSLSDVSDQIEEKWPIFPEKAESLSIDL